MNTTNTDIYTVDGGPVTVEVHRIARWTAIEIIAVRPEDDDPKVTYMSVGAGTCTRRPPTTSTSTSYSSRPTKRSNSRTKSSGSPHH
jgi:hypothetical protein